MFKGFYDKIQNNKTYSKNKAIAFFGFYLIFFIFLIILFRNLSIEDKDVDDNKLYNTVFLENNNYHYNYRINENDSILYFSGYRDEFNQEIEDYPYHYFLDLYNVKQMIAKSKYISKDEDSNGTKILTYELKNGDLVTLLDKNDHQDNNDLNKIIVYTDSNNALIKVELDITKYMHLINNDIDVYEIILEYSW